LSSLADLAPTGKLRGAINYGNFILATRARATGESRGVAIDLAQEVGRRLGVPVELVTFDSGRLPRDRPWGQASR
jgi:polar amino acid transport system substrate-binding protein